MRDVLGAVLVRGVHEVLRDERARQRAHERILVLVHGVGGQRVAEVLLGERLAHVDHEARDGAGLESLLLDLLETVMLLSHIAHERDDVEIVLLLQPLDAHGGVKTAGVGQHDTLALGFVVCLLSHDELAFLASYCERTFAS